MKIDSHHHFWSLARGDYGWLTPDLAPIYRDFTPADLEPLLDAAGIDKTVLVQASDTIAETEFLLRTARAHDRIGGVVGWIEMDAPDALDVLDRLAADPKFCGIRPMIQGIEDDEWILRPSLDPVFEALESRGLTFDALVLPRHLKPLRARLRRHPNLRCVIDHGAKPELAKGDIAAWADDIKAVAAEANAFCKLSGLLTEAGDDPTLAKIRPVAEHLICAFGPARLMFGSDWPVVNLAGDYPGWLEMVEALISGLPAEDRERIMGGTARAFYRL
ncbi:L-fuconolactonase [Rhodovulum imhoffii]|uniref:L-fuconolactonase n=1 Tax=Rhodovulum imhoffii TaxID=365340 RepID=A0A2T5BSC9_9RHOB|nr:amidohydrolase family protein [Rhodovulum imhoffii]PTN02251.1 L-fuconolactonase [Rhodovulum imhoffii]